MGNEGETDGEKTQKTEKDHDLQTLRRDHAAKKHLKETE
jgi:hypothetical protein